MVTEENGNNMIEIRIRKLRRRTSKKTHDAVIQAIRNIRA